MLLLLKNIAQEAEWFNTHVTVALFAKDFTLAQIIELNDLSKLIIILLPRVFHTGIVPWEETKGPEFCSVLDNNSFDGWFRNLVFVVFLEVDKLLTKKYRLAAKKRYKDRAGHMSVHCWWHWGRKSLCQHVSSYSQSMMSSQWWRYGWSWFHTKTTIIS